MRKYDVEYKQEVCKRIVDEGESTAQVARELGISADTIYTWVSRYREDGARSFPGSGHLRLEGVEMKRLQRENRELREENEILKKAAAYFAKNQK